ncbi:FecR domain-containing protein [Hyphomicrobium sp. 99]|uniref:FecR family protein n=1 Tax=Hyphomicrobium sp. 99 TaxID=1163419 RepID=UPI0006965A33|nr:FecR domain-containing protein [Hyphomicrobium sp. 99]
MAIAYSLPSLRNRRLIAAFLVSIAASGLPALADDATPEVGTAITIKRDVLATLGDDKRNLQEGGRVHRSEYLETGDASEAELKLDDQTKLAIGPNADLKLDDFVIGKSAGVTSIGVNFLKGTFRFITGSEKKDAYRIETPSATIGVRGTVFDVYVDGNGDTLVLLQEGEVNICTKTKSCKRHNTVGRIIHATIGGVLSEPLRFSKGLIPGIGVGTAFPFVGKTLRIDPLRRLKTADIIENPATKAGGAVKKGAGSLGRALRKALPF